MSDFDAEAFARAMNEASGALDAQIDAIEDRYVPRPEYDRVRAELRQARSVITLHQQNGCGIQLMKEGEYDRVRAERDAVRARCSLLEPIVAAARAWLDSPQPRDGEPDEMVVPLVRALDRLAAGQTGGGDVSDPWVLAGRKARDDLDIYPGLAHQYIPNVAVAIVLAAVRPEYDRVCAERDAWAIAVVKREAQLTDIRAERDAAIDVIRRLIIVVDHACKDLAHNIEDLDLETLADAARLMAGQTEAAT